MSENQTFLIANPDIVLREELNGSALLFDPDSGSVIRLNPVALAIWKLLDGKNNIDQIIHTVSQQFSDIDETVSDDIELFVNQLFEIGLIGKLLQVRES
ncbi:PqqD family peptide modification chaperone [bacterium]|nr:PqqD family peptide modification chaperone [candidate division CSSED10-310 bacterium]